MAPLLPPNEGHLFSPSHSFVLRSLLSPLHKQVPRAKKTFLPTPTIPHFDAVPRSLSSLFRRQVTTVTATATPTRNTNTVTATPLIPANYAGINDGPTPGTVVGIVFGSVAGFLLLLWLIYTCFNFSGTNARSSVVEEEVVIRRHSRSPSRRRSSPRRSPPRGLPSSRSRSESVMEEIRSTRERTPPPRRESRRETVIIEETRRPARQEDDVIEVIEEHSPAPPPPRERRKSGGFRIVDPEEFGGGNRPQRKVSRR